MNRVTICYCANRNMHIPLCVSLYTALRHLNPDYELSAHVFHTDFREKDVRQLRECLDQVGRSYNLKVSEINLDRFSRLDSLHGDRMTWGRLLLPHLLSDHHKLIYLDADTVVQADLAELWREDMGACALGAVTDGILEGSLESEIFREKGLDMKGERFNAGVLLFDVNRWNDEEWTKRVTTFASKHSGECKSADQTALNAVFHGQFCHLPAKFNELVFPDGDCRQSENIEGVLHFIGSPKPWDLFGYWLHSSPNAFRRYVDMLGLGSVLLRRQLRWENMYRTVRISRSYWRVLTIGGPG